MRSDEKLANALAMEDTYGSAEEINLQLTGLITSAIRDEIPRINLSQIFQAIAQTGSASTLDALSIVPLLLSCRDQVGQDILQLIGECGNAKEILIAAQEALERFDSNLDEDEDEDKEEDKSRSSQTGELIALLHLYTSAIPRLKFRNKTPHQTLSPIVSELKKTIPKSAILATQSEGLQVIDEISQFIQGSVRWADPPHNKSGEDVYSLLKELLYTTLESLASCVHASLSQRLFQTYFPRMVMRSVPEVEWEETERVMKKAKLTSICLQLTPQILANSPSMGALILLAHWQSESEKLEAILPSILPLLLASLRSNVALDESLSLLLTVLATPRSSERQLPAEMVISLSTVLPPLASSHPDANIRYITFRILSLTLSQTPSPLRLQILLDLTTDENFPQLRVAAVGLVKEAVIEALSFPSRAATENIFASPALLSAFGPIVFRPNPPDLDLSKLSFQELQETLETQRFVECLSFYYVLLQQDKGNLTGVRDTEVIKSIERSLLAPLRSLITQVNKQAGSNGDSRSHHMETIMPLVALQVSVERVDSTLRDLQAT